MTKIVFATHNLNKLKEVQQLMPKSIKLLSLSDINCNEEILETADTLLGNAQLKADYITQTYGYDCFADDTGLEVNALNGEPGVYSARYAGPANNAVANMAKLLTNLKSKKDRTAQFKTVIVLNLKGEQHIFEGICKGEILKNQQGNDGFGYDPIFKPEGYDKSFAEMSLEEKGVISHRGKAVKKLMRFLKNSFILSKLC
ncbi:non-canonical purine NTP diphosphatase [Aureibaculum sp. 2210JD6-5]|uniref:non-canonical purine NTP diphosphatase n=1 Tax=Aureibaculum sp. 2210JD6-5 TaxID=3103957 RepID=UPI002AAE40F5|nr:non-canonical purine NTP diphosphatase [Aureibaculum sp. 2210JD6-5]MDY7394127.1 non-canonical purine NTP diphosphatase [Aureibaculum sp. 2210JD6-5]